MKGLLIATQFLTQLPLPKLNISEAEFATSIRYFPAVGLLIGGLVAAAACVAGSIDSGIVALVALVVWVGVTGALHLDGLGDIADVQGAVHKDRERLLAVLADPHIGSFAVVAIALQLLAKLVFLDSLLDSTALASPSPHSTQSASSPPLITYIALAMIPCAARIAPLVWSRWLPNLHQGVAARFQGAVRRIDIALWLALLAIAAWFVPALLSAVLFYLLWGWWTKHRLGGISGDGHGAGIELCETWLLAALVLAKALV